MRHELYLLINIQIIEFFNVSFDLLLQILLFNSIVVAKILMLQNLRRNKKEQERFYVGRILQKSPLQIQ
jgi:hypothetical protein